MIAQPKNAWQVNLPTVGNNPVNFTFTSLLPIGEFAFKFMWFNNIWNLWVTLPTGEIRQAGMYSNLVSWSGFDDYLLGIITSLDSIGQNDLPHITMVVFQR